MISNVKLKNKLKVVCKISHYFNKIKYACTDRWIDRQTATQAGESLK